MSGCGRNGVLAVGSLAAELNIFACAVAVLKLVVGRGGGLGRLARVAAGDEVRLVGRQTGHLVVVGQIDIVS